MNEQDALTDAEVLALWQALASAERHEEATFLAEGRFQAAGLLRSRQAMQERVKRRVARYMA